MTGDALWDFALRLYARPGVAPACLALQDEAGADVTLVLYLVWCGETGRPLDVDAIAAANARLGPWRAAVVAPLRAARRAMKGGLLPGIDTEGCRERVKAVELQAERLALAALSAMAAEPSRVGPGAARRNLSLYAAHLGLTLSEEAVRVIIQD